MVAKLRVRVLIPSSVWLASRTMRVFLAVLSTCLAARMADASASASTEPAGAAATAAAATAAAASAATAAAATAPAAPAAAAAAPHTAYSCDGGGHSPNVFSAASIGRAGPTGCATCLSPANVSSCWLSPATIIAQLAPLPPGRRAISLEGFSPYYCEYENGTWWRQDLLSDGTTYPAPVVCVCVCVCVCV